MFHDWGCKITNPRRATLPAKTLLSRAVNQKLNRKLFADISASSLQVVLNQLLGLAVFLITSFGLSKEIYGELNWSVAVLSFITGILGLRLEQIIVKRTAAGEPASPLLTVFMIHVFITGILLLLILLLTHFLFPGFFSLHGLLSWICFSQLLTYFASPFRQIANGKERFDLLATIATVSNLVRVTALVACILTHAFTIRNVLIIFIAGSAMEWITGYWLVRYKMQIAFSLQTGFREYGTLLKETLPQAGAAILMAGITRMDWILMGIFSTTIFTAEYSFAYRVFELSPLPLLIVAPVLLTRLSRFYSADPARDLLSRKEELDRLIRIEMLVACYIPLVINLAWSPVFDSLTKNKYGSVNQWTFLLLSCCLPFQYISNLNWSVLFAQDKLKTILRVTAVSFMIILAGDIICIPRWGGTGAAAVYLGSMIIEYLNYLRYSPVRQVPGSYISLLVCLLAAFFSGFSAILVTENPWLRIILASTLFFLLTWATRQLRKSDLKFVYQLFSR